MSEERDDGKTPEAGAPPPTAAPAPASSVDGLRQKITDAANEFLKARMGLEEDANHALQFPNSGAFQNLGERADQFVRGFFRGFVTPSPEEKEARAGLRDPKDIPSGTEVVGRLLTRVSDVVSGSFHSYLKDHVVDAQKPDEPVVVDGRFVLRHGAPLLATFVQALGTRFGDEASGAVSASPAVAGAAPPAPEPDKAPEPASPPPPHVDYRVDLPSVFKSLFVRPTPGSDEGGK